MIWYRHADPRFPFLWESAEQPEARWHTAGEGPVQYLADTPDGAWAEFLRHEEITTAEDVENIQRALWAVEVPDEVRARPRLARGVLTGDAGSYGACRAESRRLRADESAEAWEAPSAALLDDGAGGWRVDGGLREGQAREGRVLVLFGRRPGLIGWAAAASGRPRTDLLERVRRLR